MLRTREKGFRLLFRAARVPGRSLKKVFASELDQIVWLLNQVLGPTQTFGELTGFRTFPVLKKSTSISAAEAKVPAVGSNLCCPANKQCSMQHRYCNGCALRGIVALPHLGPLFRLLDTSSPCTSLHYYASRPKPANAFEEIS